MHTIHALNVLVQGKNPPGKHVFTSLVVHVESVIHFMLMRDASNMDILELNEYNFYAVLDVEATCCNKGSIPREEMEIIEIGVVVCDSNFTPLGTKSIFIKPVRNPVLTDFCKELTNITQDNVDNGFSFSDGLKEFNSFINYVTKGDPNVLYCSWGNYDKNQFDKDCKFHEETHPFEYDHLNLKFQFADKNNLNIRKCGLGKALKLYGLEFYGTAHRGVDDARNIARLLPLILDDRKLGDKT